MATMMQTRAPPCTRSTSRSHLPTTSRSQPRILLGNKSCHARWTGLWSRSWPRLALGEKLTEPISNSCSKKGPEPGPTLFQTMPWASMWSLPSSEPWSACGFACLLPILTWLAPCVMALQIASGTTPVCAPAGATGSRDTTSCATSWQGVPALLACNRKSRNRTCSLHGRSSRGAPKMDHSLVEMAVAQLMSGSPTGTFMALPLFDVAVTSGLRQGHLAASAADGSKASMDYEVRKCHHLDTLQACATEGLQFIPFVVEACGGGWGPTALKTWRSLSAAIAARTSESSSVELQRLLQALGIALHRENARAIMRRLEWSTILDRQWLLRNLPERATEPPPGCLHLGSPSRLAFALSSPAPFFPWPGGWGSPFPVSWQLPFFATASARADGLSLLLGNTTLLPCSRRAHFFLPYNGSLCFTFVRQCNIRFDVQYPPN